MCVIPQVVWAPLNPVPTIEHLGGGFVPRFTATRLSHFYRQFSVSGEIPYVVSKIKQLINDNGEVFVVQSIETYENLPSPRTILAIL